MNKILFFDIANLTIRQKSLNTLGTRYLQLQKHTHTHRDTHTHTPSDVQSPPSAAVSQVARLPKLEMPQFTGNPLQWQSFWDCFEAAIHNNTSLAGVQKLGCLRIQLREDPACIIASFQLTNDNYSDSVILLKERFGQTHTQVDAHKQALIDTPTQATRFPACENSVTPPKNTSVTRQHLGNQKTLMVAYSY